GGRVRLRAARAGWRPRWAQCGQWTARDAAAGRLGPGQLLHDRHPVERLAVRAVYGSGGLRDPNRLAALRHEALPDAVEGDVAGRELDAQLGLAGEVARVADLGAGPPHELAPPVARQRAEGPVGVGHAQVVRHQQDAGRAFLEHLAKA